MTETIIIMLLGLIALDIVVMGGAVDNTLKSILKILEDFKDGNITIDANLNLTPPTGGSSVMKEES